MTESENVFLAEQELAGCLLVSPDDTVKLVKDIVKERDFSNRHIAAIYRAAAALVLSHRPCDPVLIKAEADKFGVHLEDTYISELMKMYLTTANVELTAKQIHEESIQRQAREIGELICKNELSAYAAIEKLQEVMREESSRLSSPMEDANRVMDFISAAAEGKANPHIRTGYSSLDERMSGGMPLGAMVTIAARPGTGKTTAGLNIAENVTKAGGKVLYFSLEMTKEQLWSCRVAMFTGISRSKIYAGKLETPDEWRQVTDAFQELSKREFYIRDIPAHIDDIEREVRCMDGLTLAIVDHIGLVKSSQRGSRYEIVTAISHRIQGLAQSTKIPILTLCQLNRQSEQREGKRPTMADLRDSGAVEEDSDTIILLFRPAQYMKEEERPKPWESQDIEFIFDKCRGGIVGTSTLNFCGTNSRITEKAYDY